MFFWSGEEDGSPNRPEISGAGYGTDKKKVKTRGREERELNKMFGSGSWTWSSKKTQSVLLRNKGALTKGFVPY